MSVTLKELTAYLDRLLGLEEFSSDCSNNGLQVEASAEVRKAVFGVDASAAMFAEAADRDADFIFVHHGISWGNGFKYFRGHIADRLRLLFCNEISLYGVHLPLDAHPELGHNALLADMLGLQDRQPFWEYSGKKIGFSGILPQSLSLRDIAEIYADRLDCDYVIYGEEDHKVVSAGIISGGGADAVIEAGEAGLGCLITGEMQHQVYHDMLESGVPVIALGHYKSETPGVLKVMELVRETFNIECEFIDIPTGL